MWKCPKCSQKNRIDVCSKCGYERIKSTSASISSLNFILMAVISIAIIIGIFFSVDFYIDSKRKAKSEEARLQKELSEERYEEEMPKPEKITAKNLPVVE